MKKILLIICLLIFTSTAFGQFAYKKNVDDTTAVLRALIADKIDSDSVYTKTQIDSIIALYYTPAQIDSILATYTTRIDSTNNAIASNDTEIAAEQDSTTAQRSDIDQLRTDVDSNDSDILDLQNNKLDKTQYTTDSTVIDTRLDFLETDTANTHSRLEDIEEDITTWNTVVDKLDKNAVRDSVLANDTTIVGSSVDTTGKANNYPIVWNQTLGKWSIVNILTDALIPNDLTINSTNAITTTSYIQGITGRFTNLTNGYVPYHVGDAIGFSDSPIYTNGTNVGIGTTAPGTKLHVAGNGVISRIDDTGSASAGNLRFANNGTDKIFTGIVTVDNWGGLPTGTLVNDGFTRFDGDKYLFTASNATHVMTLKSTGNVGIGTTSPGQKLEVAGNIQLPSNGFLYWKSNNINARTVDDVISQFNLRGTATYHSILNMYGTGDAAIVNKFNTAGNSYITGGNVGIGTTAPGTKLHIVGTFTIEASDGDQTAISTNVNDEQVHSGASKYTFDNNVEITGSITASSYSDLYDQSYLNTRFGYLEDDTTTTQDHIANTSNPHSVDKGDVGLGNVENVALSSWGGSSNIITVGALASGTIPWSLLTSIPSKFDSSMYSDTTFAVDWDNVFNKPAKVDTTIRGIVVDTTGLGNNFRMYYDLATNTFKFTGSSGAVGNADSLGNKPAADYLEWSDTTSAIATKNDGYLTSESDPIWISDSSNYLSKYDASQTYVDMEADPIWVSDSSVYLSKYDASQSYTNFTNADETDQVWINDSSNYLMKSQFDDSLANSSITESQISDLDKYSQAETQQLISDSLATISGASVTHLNYLELESALQTLEIQEANSITGFQSKYMIRDIFSDTTGFLNTVDTNNSTAVFETDKYPNKVYQEGSDITEGHGITISSLFNTNNSMGMAITPNKDIILKSVTKVSSANPTRCRLFYSDGTGLGSLIATTTTLNGDVFTFSTGILLESGVKYKIELDNNGSNYNAYNNNTVSTYPITETDFTWNAGSMSGNDNTSNALNIVSITYSVSNLVTDDAIVQTSLQTLDSAPSNCQIYGWKKATTGTGSITVDISFDNGVNWQTDVSLDTATEVVNTGTQMILKINLNAGASEGTAELKGYGVLFW